jgi:dihydrofolate reductase
MELTVAISVRGQREAEIADAICGRAIGWVFHQFIGRTTRLDGITAMAKVISTLFISADGVAEIDPDWHFPYFDENMGRAVSEDYDTGDVLLIGRETYDSFAGAWPGRETAGEDDASFAKQLGDMRKVVVSRQPLTFSWRNSELINGDLVEVVTALKADAGVRGILIPGSISVVRQLLAAGLVDELRLLVHPVAARKGRRLFDDGDAPYHLKVTATEVFPTGVIRVIYSPTEAPATVGYDEIKDQAPGGKSG